MSVISLPDRDEAVAKAVDQVWEHYLQYVEDVDDLRKERKRKPPVAAALEGLHRRGGLRGDPGPQAGRHAGTDKSVKQAEFETLIARQGGDRQRQARRRLLRPLARREPHWDQALDGSRRAGRPGPSAPRGGRPGRASPASRPSSPDIEGELEMGVTPGAAGPRVDLAPGRREPGRGGLPPVQAARRSTPGWSRPAVEAPRASSSMAGFECWKQDHEQEPAQVPRPALPHAPLALAPADHGGLARVRLPGQLDPRAGSTPGAPATASCSTPARRTPRARWAAWSRRGGRSPATSRRRSTWAGSAPTTRSVPSTTRENQHECRFLHGAACHGCLLIAETSLRAAQRLPRPGAGRPDRRRPRRRVLRLRWDDGRPASLACRSEDLRRLAEASARGRLGPPYPALAVRRFVPDSQAAEVAATSSSGARRA